MRQFDSFRLDDSYGRRRLQGSKGVASIDVEEYRVERAVNAQDVGGGGRRRVGSFSESRPPQRQFFRSDSKSVGVQVNVAPERYFSRKVSSPKIDFYDDGDL